MVTFPVVLIFRKFFPIILKKKYAQEKDTKSVTKILAEYPGLVKSWVLDDNTHLPLH